MKKVELGVIFVTIVFLTFFSCSKDEDVFDPSNPSTYGSLKERLKGRTYSYFYTAMSGNNVSYNIEFTDTNTISVTSEYAESREIIRKKTGTYSVDGEKLIFQVGEIYSNPWYVDILNAKYMGDSLDVYWYQWTHNGTKRYVQDFFILRK
jgi:hypothetical protein